MRDHIFGRMSASEVERLKEEIVKLKSSFKNSFSIVATSDVKKDDTVVISNDSGILCVGRVLETRCHDIKSTVVYEFCLDCYIHSDEKYNNKQINICVSNQKVCILELS